MTSKEAFETLKANLCGMCACGSQCMESCDIRSCDNRDAIKVLEQQGLVLDKARSEILDLADYDAYGDVQQAFGLGLMRAVQVIDKCKTEVEPKASEE